MLFDESRQARKKTSKEREAEAKQEVLLKAVGQLTLERIWLKKIR